MNSCRVAGQKTVMATMNKISEASHGRRRSAISGLRWLDSANSFIRAVEEDCKQACRHLAVNFDDISRLKWRILSTRQKGFDPHLNGLAAAGYGNSMGIP